MIGIKVEKAHGEYDVGTSKFLGAPTMPEEWLEDGTIGEDDFFFCQLKASEYKAFDKENLLPKTGFIYFFLTESEGEYIPNVRYCADEPDTLIDDFNAGFDFLGDTDAEYSIDYFCGENTEDGTGILKVLDNKVTLLQYDPLDDNMPDFLADTEKVVSFCMDKEDLLNLDFSKVSFELV